MSTTGTAWPSTIVGSYTQDPDGHLWEVVWNPALSVVLLDAKWWPSTPRGDHPSRHSHHRSAAHIVYYAFDILHLDGSSWCERRSTSGVQL